jgi:predicted membrane channel-forming protein YqfA (hemolysin III family)
MTSKKKYGVLSTILSIVGILLFIISYSISKNPTSGEKVIIGIFFFSAIACMITSIVLGIVEVKSKEKGFLKYTGILLVLVFVLGVALQPILMALFGIGEP